MDTDTDTDTDSSGPLSLAFGIGRKLVRCLANYYYTIASELTILKAKKGRREERREVDIKPTDHGTIGYIFLFPSPSLGKRVLPPSFVNVFRSVSQLRNYAVEVEIF